MSQKALTEQLYEALAECRNLHRSLVEHGVAQRRWYDSTEAQRASELVKTALDRYELEKDKADLDRVSNPITVIVDFSSGVIQGASANGPVHLIALDYNDDAYDDDEIFEIPQNGGGDASAYVNIPVIDQDPAWIQNVHTALLGQGVIY